MKIISVVRNFEMYERLVKNNPFNQKAEFFCFDNRQENVGISARYNQFLNAYDFSEDDWFVFCHEDWEVKESLNDALEKLDKTRIYGVLGIRSFRLGQTVYEHLVGYIEESQKDGSELMTRGELISCPRKVDTFDCQCLIVHSSLVKKFNLRFDENLTFDLYGEDFSIAAKEKYGIKSYVIPLACQHYSRGTITQRFVDGIKYLNQKYASTRRIYANVVNPSLLVYDSRRYGVLKDIPYHKSVLNSFYSRKVTRSGKVQIKICKIPVASFKIKT